MRKPVPMPPPSQDVASMRTTPERSLANSSLNVGAATVVGTVDPVVTAGADVVVRTGGGGSLPLDAPRPTPTPMATAAAITTRAASAMRARRAALLLVGSSK